MATQSTIDRLNVAERRATAQAQGMPGDEPLPHADPLWTLCADGSALPPPDGTLLDTKTISRLLDGD